MPYDTYSALKDAVASMLHRSDLTAQIPDFIRLAEMEINRRLTIFPKEATASLVSSPGARTVPLPADFGSPIILQSTYIEPRYDFTLVETTQLPINDVNARLPWYWAIDGGNIAFECPTDLAYPLLLRYLQTVYLSEAAPTNAVFARAGDLYLYGALAHSAEWTRDDARLVNWQRRYLQLLSSVAADASRSKGMAPLQTEIPESLSASNSGVRDWRLR